MEKKDVMRIAGGLLLLYGIVFILNSGSDITGAAIGAGSQIRSNLIIGFFLILAGSNMLIASIERQLKFFESYRDGRRMAMMTDPMHLIDPHSDSISLDAVRQNFQHLGSREREDIREAYSGILYSRRDNADRLSEGSEAKRADDVLKVIEGDSYVPFISRDDALVRLPHQLRHLIKGDPYYVHFTSQDSARWVVNKGHGFYQPGKQTAVQALIFPKKKDAERFIEGIDQKTAEKITGASSAEKAIVFRTKVIPTGVNTVLSGCAKALFHRSLPLPELQDVEVYAVKRR